MLPIGMTTASDAITINEAAQATFVLVNVFSGLPPFMQVHSLDTSSTQAIPLASSDGHSTPVPVAGSDPFLVARVFNNAGGTTATAGIYLGTSTIGYGLPIAVT